MRFAQTHDTLWYNPKFGSLSMAARGLWVTCQSWCAGQLTDGLIPASAVKIVGGTDPQIRALVKSGLWIEAETKDGELAYQFHDWLDHNEAADRISAKKRKERERSAARREAENAPEPGEDSSRNAPESGKDPTRTTPEPTRDSTRNAPESRGISPSRTPSDLYEPENDRVASKEKRTELNSKSRVSVCAPARPTGESHTPGNDPEAKDETEEKPKRKRPRNGMDILAARYSDSRGKEPVVDVSASGDQDSARGVVPDDYNYAPLMHPHGEPGNTSAEPAGGQAGSSLDSRESTIGKRLEDMAPSDLLRYIVLSQEELNGIMLSSSGPKGIATMKRFQEHYGPERAAAIMRHLFVKEKGKYEVGKNGVEHITQDHFTGPLSWFTDKIDVKTQEKASSEKYVIDNFVFASEL